MRSLLLVFVIGAFITASQNARAHVPLINACFSGGRGSVCTNNAQCIANGDASVCVDSTCQIPCAAADGQRAPNLCALGERCAAGETPTGETFYCQSTA